MAQWNDQSDARKHPRIMDSDWSNIVPLTVGYVSFRWTCIALHCVHHNLFNKTKLLNNNVEACER